MQAAAFDYPDGETVCEGFAVVGEDGPVRRPAVLIAHQWSGQGESERAAAGELAAQGYFALAIDVYGKGMRGGSTNENAALMKPWTDDRGALRRRLLAAVAAAAAHPRVDPERMAVMGFCFGGLCALDLVRSGDPRIKAAISVHGLFSPPGLGPQSPISASILVQHGYADPLAPPTDLLALATELTDAGADWQVQAYGHAMHAFTAPEANAPAMGMAYNEKAARRSKESRSAFLREAFAVG